MPHPIFTPTALDPARLDEVTVGRVDVLDRLVRRMHGVATTSARPHTLVVGPRGSGKTHLLSVVLHRARQDPAVSARLAVAWVPEDALAIGCYDDLLVEIARTLCPDADDRARALRRARDARGLERLLLDLADGRVLVLVLENLDRIFAAVGPAGQAALRGFTETAASVALLASAPLLFAGVSSRDHAWYGSFDVEHLDDLTLADGTALLHRAARAGGDEALARYVESATGQARLRAVEQLAGGSPRLWHILSGCITVEALDELIPAVEALLDELAPYYQQRLWELPASEQKLVVELGRASGARTVTDLADAVGVTNRVAATALGRLADARWVRGRKVAGTDQRTTWYELREPLLRHHLQYRDARGEPLRFIVEFLRLWFSQDERRRHLAAVDAGSAAERHLARTLLSDAPSRFDSAWADRDADQLLADVRCWIAGASQPERLAGSPALGVAIEAVVLAARDVDRTLVPPLRSKPQLSSDIVDGVLSAVSAVHSRSGSVAGRVGAGLRFLLFHHTAWPPEDGDLLTLMLACWDGQSDPAVARDILAELVARRQRDHGPCAWAIRVEHAFWTGEAGNPAGARELFAALVADRARLLGPDDPDTLTLRHGLAYWTGQAGDPAGARDLFAAVAADRDRVLGPDNQDTLVSRLGLACWTGEAGDPASARELSAALAVDYARALGSDDRATLACRQIVAAWIGQAGDPVGARDLSAALAADRERVLGRDDQDTLFGRLGLASWTGRAGDPANARDLSAALITDQIRALGQEHPDTLAGRHSQAYWTGLAGDPAGARDLFTALVPDRLRVLGPDHPDSLSSRHNLADWTGEAGDPAGARDLFTALVADCARVLGSDHAVTGASRRMWVAWAVRAGCDLAPVAAVLGGDFDAVAADLMLSGALPQSVVGQLLGYVANTEGAGRLAMAALLAPGSSTEQARRDVLAATSALVPSSAIPLLRRIADALNGDAAARAGLPPELRPMVQHRIDGAAADKRAARQPGT